MKRFALMFLSCAAMSLSASDQSACAAGDAAACESLGVHYITGDGVRIDGYTAIKYLERACSLGKASACNGAAFIYADAEGGVRQDYTKAMRYWRKACSYGDPTGCANYRLAQKKIEEARRKGTLRKAPRSKSNPARHYDKSPLDALSGN
ncbi:tetratricopeptide repeat protein [Nitratifractor sp.]